MNQDEFWKIIDGVNKQGPYTDEETHLCKVYEALSHYSLDDILDWHLIQEEYKKAAVRSDLKAASASAGICTADDSFVGFCLWLISCGKEMYMNTLKNPESLHSLSLTEKTPNFPRFGYAAYYAYEAKLFHTDPEALRDLYSDLKGRALSSGVLAALHEELPKWNSCVDTIEILDLCGDPVCLKPRLELYTVRDFMGKEMPGLAIVFDEVSEYMEEYDVLTVSFGEFIGLKDSAYIDTNNCWFAQQLLDLGIAEDTGFHKSSGFCNYPLWVFKSDFLKAIGEANYKKYEQSFDAYMHPSDEEIDQDYGITMS